MKHRNIISLALAALLACALFASACAEEDAGAATGAWAIRQGPVSMEQNAQARAAMDKAPEGLTGAAYEAVAVLGTQVVAGTNYCILCRVTPVAPDAEGSFCLVAVYRDAGGRAEMTEIHDLDIAGGVSDSTEQ